VEDAARRFDVVRHVRFGVEAREARWLDDRGKWTITMRDGKKFEARFFVSATGVLFVPNIPGIKVSCLDAF
jgi:cation diffusion facilitator CzcD-associated flavoprotein CzcO